MMTITLVQLAFLLCPSLSEPYVRDCRPCVRKLRVGGPDLPQPRKSFEQIDHSPFDHLLHRFVDCRGQVCYRKWRKDCAAADQLHRYLISLGAVDTTAPASTEAKLAFYMNAYNGLAIWGILQEYPSASIQQQNRPGADFRIFSDLELWIDREYLSLNSIEHGRLRVLDEPRIHFALVCAAKGCPRLRNEAYRPDRLDEQLADNAIDFFARPNRFRICHLTASVKVSPVFKWYREDFGDTDQEVLAAMAPYLCRKDQEWLLSHPCAKLKYLGYNWGLNDGCPVLRVWLGRIPYAFYARFEPVLGPFLPWFRSQGTAEREVVQENGAGQQAEPGPPPPRPIPSASRRTPRRMRDPIAQRYRAQAPAQK